MTFSESPPRYSAPARRRCITQADPPRILPGSCAITSRSRGQAASNEVKLIFMGRGGVGKTSLVNRLVRGEFDPESAKTEGIQITRWALVRRGLGCAASISGISAGRRSCTRRISSS